VEVSFEDLSNKPDGSLDGDIVTWKGIGAGRFLAGGAAACRGCLARLNTIAGVFEFEVDAEGNTHSQIWEWK
jgi:hypothetical protein